MKAPILFASSVGGGPLARLVKRLREQGVDAELVSMYSPEAWRAQMARGRAGRFWARFSTNVAFPLLFAVESLKKPGAIVVPTTNPASLPLVSVLTKVLHGNRVAPLVYDLYPDALEAGELVHAESWISRFAIRVNRFWFRESDGVVFIGGAMRRHCLQRYGEPRNHTVIETGADAQELAGSDAASSSLVISYVGNLGAMHDWQTLATALPQLDQELVAANAKVIIAASGVGAERLRDATQGCQSVEFRPPLDDEAWRRLVNGTAISLVTLKQSAAMTCVPSKAFSAMAAGSAIVAVAPANSDLASLVREHACGEVVEPGQHEELVSALRRLLQDRRGLAKAREAARRAAVERYDMSLLARRWRRFLGELPRSSPGRWYSIAKRALDLGAAGGALVALSPVLTGAAIAVFLSMGRPVLFVQERPGLRGRTFPLFKFRSMRAPRAGEEGPEADEARLTKVGRFLRATSLDELPSLLNVVRGEMSLVGPRPLLVRYLPRYTAEQARRHDVRPGLTGWAQVNGRNALSWEEKFALDVWYVDNRSLVLDLKIIVRTVLSVLRREGISQEGHATMPEFMGSERMAAE